MATTSTQFVTWEGLQYFAEQFSKTNIAAMDVTTIVTNILSIHDNNTIPTTQAVYEYAAAAVDLNNDVTYTLGMTNTSASLATLRNRSTSAAIHPETEAAAVLTNTPGKTLAKALSSGVSYTEGPTGGVSTDNLSGYYSKTQVDELLDEKQDKPNVGSFPIFLDLSGEADYQLYQGNMPGYNWGWTSLSGFNTWNSLAGSFMQGAQTAEAGKSYLALFGRASSINGLSASVFTVGSDGSSITWDATKRWDLQVGCEVVMPNGAHYRVVKTPNTGRFPIYNAVSPIIGKIPLSLSSNSTINVKGLENVEATLASTTTTWQAAVRFTDCKDSNFHVDLSQMGYSGGAAGSQCIFSFSKDDKPIQPLNFNSYGLMVNPQTNGQNTDSIVNSSGMASNVPVRLFAENPKIDLVNGRWQTVLYARYSQYVTSDGKFVRRDFDINFLGDVPMVSPTYAEEDSSPSAQATMMKARSLSVEPPLSEEDFNNAIKGKKGIFIVKGGRPFDLIMNEYAD